MDRGSGVGGAPLLHEQMLDDVGLAAAADPQFVVLRNATRDKILEYIGRKQSSADWRRRLPELARRLEEILFRKFPNKGPMEPPLQYAIKFLSAQNTQRQRNLERSSQGASSLGYGTIMPTPGEAPDEHVNTLLSLGMNSTHLRSRVSNNNPAPSAPAEDVPKEPKFSCPVCMNELVDASSTICGHIFCQYCIGASILAQSKCPTCRRTLSLNDFHRVYLPTME
uniref:Uncharacterized protein n=1 Tax=Avena sativa TaxID=4498 RepID=A0ACD5XEU7_AVESA